MLILDPRSSGTLRTKSTTSLPLFGISEKNSAPNFLLPKHLYGKNFKPNQTLYGLLFRKAKISSLLRATELAENSQTRPMPSETSSTKELRLQLNGCPRLLAKRQLL